MKKQNETKANNYKTSIQFYCLKALYKSTPPDWLETQPISGKPTDWLET